MLCAIRASQFPIAKSEAKSGGVTYLKKGIIAITFGNENTNTMNSGIYGEGSWLGSSMINQSVHLHASIEELEPVEVIYFPKERIDALAATDPFVYKWLYHCSVKAQQQWLFAQITSLHDRQTRVVFTLLEIARLMKTVKGSFIKVSASQKQLSAITGISRPRLNEVLKMLESSGEISIERGSIHLIEPSKLQHRLSVLDGTIRLN